MYISVYKTPFIQLPNFIFKCSIAGNTASFAKDAALIKKVDKHLLQTLFFDWIYNKEMVTVYYGACEGAPENTQSRHRNWDLAKF